MCLIAASFTGHCQDIALHEQFNGRYDFTFVGNTLNPSENNPTPTCTIFTSSSANLNLGPDDEVIAAYLYWAGSGTGDFDIELNGVPITSERDFPLNAVNTDGLTRAYFSAFADVTAQVQATGNGTYTVSELDLTAVVATNLYCSIKTNFGGWAIVVIYENNNLPLNQLNLYDGLQYVPTAINITLPSLNVVDNVGAKIGFLAWEGDSSLAVTESLKINGNTLSNALNPSTNAFNSTNSITGSNQLYNMDLDVYDIQNNIQIGDESAEISLESGQDFVMVNAIVTKLNSQLPDATIAVDDIAKACNSRTIEVTYTVSNVNSTNPLPAGTPIAVYLNGDFLASAQTNGAIPIGGSQEGTITLTIPNDAPLDFELIFVVDDTGNGEGVVTETDETNNTFLINDFLLVSPPLEDPDDIIICEELDPVFDFSAYEETLKNEPTDTVAFYRSSFDALTTNAPITDTSSFEASSNPQEIFVRLENEDGCFTIGSFLLIQEDCLFPDGTVLIGNIDVECNFRTIEVDYIINNFNSDDILPWNTPVAIFGNGILITTFVTQTDIPVGGSESGSIGLIIPFEMPDTFQLMFYVDNSGNGTGIIEEISEINNTYVVTVTLPVSPPLEDPADITSCDIGDGTGVFDFSGYLESLKNEPTDVVSFHTTFENADNDEIPITNNAGYPSTSNPQEIFVRLENEEGCYTIGSFLLLLEDCLFPDATIETGDIAQECNSRTITVEYTVSNTNGHDILPAGTPIAIYANGIFILATETTQDIAINESESGVISVTIPANLPLDVDLMFSVDDSGNTSGIVQEIDEDNNTFTVPVSLTVSPVLQDPQDITSCDTGKGTGVFDFSEYETSLLSSPTDVVTFHITEEEAEEDTNFITDTSSFDSSSNPQEIFVRLENEDGCYTIGSFLLIVEDCMFPDATVVFDNTATACNSMVIEVNYTINNFDSFDVLPGGTPVAIYADGNFIDFTETLLDIPVGGSESNTITVTLPEGMPLDFELSFVVDDIGNGTGIVEEINETNNNFAVQVSIPASPAVQQPKDVVSCNRGFGSGLFDFSHYEEELKTSPADIVTFYRTQAGAEQDTDRIYNTSEFVSEADPQEIFVKVQDEAGCYSIISFNLVTKKCPPVTYNYITPNGDGYNDSFFVEGLRNIFLNFKMSIYNRWGSLVWTGDHSRADWDGIATEDKVGSADTTVPVGTYYFVLELNDPDYPEPIVGWVYVTR